MKYIYETIDQYNKWRKGEDNLKMCSPKELSVALEKACEIIRNIEKSNIKEMVSYLDDIAFLLKNSGPIHHHRIMEIKKFMKSVTIPPTS